MPTMPLISQSAAWRQHAMKLASEHGMEMSAHHVSCWIGEGHLLLWRWQVPSSSGHAPYTVTEAWACDLASHDEQYALQCECAASHFGGKPCKHLGSVLLAIDNYPVREPEPAEVTP